MSLNWIYEALLKQFEEYSGFVDLAELSILLFKRAEICEIQFSELVHKFIEFGGVVETFETEDLLQVILKFYVLYEVYKLSIEFNSFYVGMSEFYNCSNEEIIDICCC